MKTQYLCFPLNTKPPAAAAAANSTNSSSSPAINSPVSPRSSMLNRFRNVVFRLIMATAISKANDKKSSLSSKSSSSNNHSDYYYRNNSNLGQDSSVRRSCYLYDPYHSEALADCIEFIKKKSATASPSDHHGRLHDDHHDIGDYDDDDDEITRDSIVRNEVVIPLPVM